MPARSHASTARRTSAAAVSIAVVAVALFSAAQRVQAASGPAQRGSGVAGRHIDVRRAVAPSPALAAASAVGRADLAGSLGRMGVFELDPLTGTPRVVGRLDGFLTGPSAAAPARIAMGFVRRHLGAFGLTRRYLATCVLSRSYRDIDGITHVSWIQQVDGVRAFDNGLEAAVTRSGRLIVVNGPPAHDLGAGVAFGNVRISSTGAAALARSSVGAAPISRPDDQAQMVLFHGGRSRLAWQTLTTVSLAERDLSVVDAATGQVLWRTNLVHADATGSDMAWDYYPSTSVPNSGGVQHPVTFPVKDGTRLAGNNAHVYKDVNDDNTPVAGDEIPAGTGVNWTTPLVVDTTTAAQNCAATWACTWDRTTPNSWQASIPQDAAQVYYYLNTYHKHLQDPPIGFTEAAGNFQLTNASGKGRGGDPVQGQIFDGAATNGGLPDAQHYNNANFFTPPDGQAPVMQLYLFHADAFTPSVVSGNGGDDASVVYHEYTHGLSGRLVTYPNGLEALSSSQSGALGEAWSDWYALDFLTNEGFIDDTVQPGDVKEGFYITGGTGIRVQGIDCTRGAPAGKCPGGFRTGPGGFTYDDYGKVAPGPEVHSDGEIWAQTLWDLRTALGSTRSEQLITRGMALTPPDPSFLDARNGILQADVAVRGGQDLKKIWAVFAHRGMGFFASTADGNDIHPTANFATPPSCAGGKCATLSGTITNGVTGAPMAGVLVAIGGHDSGLPATNLLARTNAHGHYAIAKVPFHTYADVVIDRKGIDPTVLHGVSIFHKEAHVSRAVDRDWAAIDGGAKVVFSTKPDYTAFGCGPSGAFDRSLLTGWGSDAPHAKIGSNVTGPRSVVVRLPRAIHVTSFAIDPGPTCGDGPSAGLRAFDIFTRAAHGAWTLAYRRASTPFPQGRLTTLLPIGGVAHVRFVKLVMRANRGNNLFMDMSELSVRGR